MKLISYFKSVISKKIITYFLVLFLINNVNAQLTLGHGYIKGTSVEIGVDNIGGFEGAPLAPAGFHPRGGASGKFGFVANPAVDGWATWNGDFFTPGTPENGWGIQIGATQLSNNCQPTPGPPAITGTLTGYTHVLDCYNLDWAGSVTSGTNVIGAKVNYFLQEFDLFYTTTVVLTNNSTTTIPLMYYYRNVDPDNNQSYPGGPASFTTINKIEDQAGSASGCQLACVSASQSPSGVMPASYMAFAAVGSEYRVSYGGFSNRSGSDIWNAASGLIGTLGSVRTADEAISLSYRIQNFLPGESRTIKFVTILNAADKNLALANLLYLSYPGSGFFPPSSCSPVVDTVKACGGSTIIQVDGPNYSDYTWSWSPGTFLSSTTSYSAVVTPTAIIVYTITGTPISTVCVSPIPLSYTIAVKPLPPLPVTISPSLTLCQNSSGTLIAGGGSFYVWTGPSSYSGSGATVTITATSTLSTGNYTAVITNTNGCTATATVDVYIIPSPSITVNSPTICAGQTATLNASGSVLTSYTWTPGGTTGTSYTIVPVTTTTVMVSASDGTCGVVATSTISILTFSANSATICPGQTAILTPTGSVTSYSWSTGATTSSISVSPSSTTVYTLTGVASTCSLDKSITVNVVPYPTITISTPTVCPGIRPVFFINISGSVGTPTISPASSILTGTSPSYTITAPAFASTGTISIVASNGICNSTSIGTVVVIPSPTITVNSPTICAGQTATLNASGSALTSYTWTPGGTTGTSYTIVPVTTTTIMVNASDGTCSVSATSTISILSFSVNSATICPGQTAILTPTGSVSSYSWSTGVTTSSISVSPSSTTVYTLTGIASTCSSTITTTVNVTPSPTITISTPTVCVGTQPVFLVNVSGATSTPTVLPISAVVLGTSPSYTVTTPIFASTGTISVFASNGSCPTTKTGTVVVIPNPTITVTSSSTICAGQTVILTASGANSYTWTPSGTTNSIVVSPSSTTIYSVTGINTLGNCYSGKTTTVIVIPTPIASFIGLTNAQTFTVGNVLNITNTSTNYTSFNWTLCDGSNSNAMTISIPLIKAEDCCIKLVADNSYCKDSLTRCYRVVPEFYLITPNVFTPNGDNANDVFKFKNSGISEMNVIIYDRWGLKMYEWNGTTGYWDGNAKSGPATAGTYFYILNYTKIGETEFKTEKGFFSLFRN